jgi:dethiobiotin synthetase
VIRSLFVTGTDTGVGKTVTSAVLMRRLRHLDCRYWKPVQTGIETDDDTWTVEQLSDAASSRFLREGIRLPRALSPHLSARLHRTRIVLADLVAMAARRHAGTWIVEGAGGVLVPLNESELMVDLMRALSAPAVIVARSGLGTINHTLLTIEALRHRDLPVVGVIMVGDRNPDNRAAIEKYGALPVLGEIGWYDPLTPAVLKNAALALDPDRHLERALEPVP